MGRILELKRHMMKGILFAFDEIQSVMIWIASQEDKKILDPVGNAKAEALFVEVRYCLGVRDREGDMPELHRSNAESLLARCHEGPFGEQLDHGTFRIAEHDG